MTIGALGLVLWGGSCAGSQNETPSSEMPAESTGATTTESLNKTPTEPVSKAPAKPTGSGSSESEDPSDRWEFFTPKRQPTKSTKGLPAPGKWRTQDIGNGMKMQVLKMDDYADSFGVDIGWISFGGFVFLRYSQCRPDDYVDRMETDAWVMKAWCPPGFCKDGLSTQNAGWGECRAAIDNTPCDKLDTPLDCEVFRKKGRTYRLTDFLEQRKLDPNPLRK